MLRNMKNVLIDRINERLAIKDKAASAVSIEATGAKETLRKILDGTTKNPRIDTLRKIAQALGTTHNYLLGETDFPGIPDTAGTRSEEAPTLVRPPVVPVDVPVMGTAAGSLVRGAFQLEGGVIDYVRRPPALLSAKDIYALFVVGSSMEPQYFPGDLIYINPHKPVKNGDIVVIQTKISENSPMEASLGILLKQTEKNTIIGKRNPVADLVIDRDTIVHVHRVLSVNELFGA
ncbi:S24 family peptidase [Agrobacterium vitis]